MISFFSTRVLLVQLDMAGSRLVAYLLAIARSDAGHIRSAKCPPHLNPSSDDNFINLARYFASSFDIFISSCQLILSVVWRFPDVRTFVYVPHQYMKCFTSSH